MAGLHVQEVIEESLVAGNAGCLFALGRVGKKTNGLKRAAACFCTANITTFYAHRVCRQRKTNGGDAGERRCRIAIGYETVVRIRGIPEIMESFFFDIVEKRT